MPCLYAHYVFGEEVRGELSGEIQNCIDTYRDAFDWGLQGPDFLFFYQMTGKKIIQKMGSAIHKKSLAAYIHNLLPTIRKKGVNSPECAYFLGFICHYMLDSQCHPYINFWKEQGFAHADTEKAFDQYLMQMEGKDFGKEPLHDYLPLSKSVFQSIAACYPWMQKRHLFISILSYVAAKRVFYAPGVAKRKIITFLSKRFGKYRKLKRHFYWEEMPKQFDRNNIRLYLLYGDARRQTVGLVEHIWSAVKGKEEIIYTERMFLDFGGLKKR